MWLGCRYWVVFGVFEEESFVHLGLFVKCCNYSKMVIVLFFPETQSHTVRYYK